jgi:hypothetical protein
MSLGQAEWAIRSTEHLNSKMIRYCQECVPIGIKPESKGFLERHDLPQNSDVTVVGDIHGNDLRLDITLKSLQTRGFLDGNYRCLPGKYVVFLGDFVDRGINSLKVLELVTTLKLENKDQVFLLRGNHEDLQTSFGKIPHYAANDSKYFNYMFEFDNLPILADFYASLPLGLYLGQQNKTSNSTPEYMYFVHGLFYLYNDPSPIFNQSANDYLWLEETQQFTPRILKLMEFQDKKLSKREIKQHQSALKLNNLRFAFTPKFDDIYWLDADDIFSLDISTGRVSVETETIKAYLRLSGGHTAKVKELIRGHQIGVWVLKDTKEKIVLTTLDPSTNTGFQTYMEIKISEKVRDWKKSYITIPLFKDHTQALSLQWEDNSVTEKNDISKYLNT